MISPASPQPVVISCSATAMTHEDLDRLLDELDTATEALLADQAAAEQRVEEVERLLKRTSNDGATFWAPADSVISLREDLALEAFHRHRRAVRAFVSWWADVAALAVQSAIGDNSPDPVRVMAANPVGLRPDELDRLAPIPESDRQLAELSLHLATGPMGGDAGSTADPVTTAQAAARRCGLAIRSDADGGVILVESGEPEALRQRLWGAVWDQCQAPALPDTGELVEALRNRGVKEATVAAVGAASQAVEEALAAAFGLVEAHRRLAAGEILEETTWAEEDDKTLDERAEQLLARLVDYARTIAAHLPHIRASRPT